MLQIIGFSDDASLIQLDRLSLYLNLVDRLGRRLSLDFRVQVSQDQLASLVGCFGIYTMMDLLRRNRSLERFLWILADAMDYLRDLFGRRSPQHWTRLGDFSVVCVCVLCR